jgi:hypothetical protein
MATWFPDWTEGDGIIDPLGPAYAKLRDSIRNVTNACNVAAGDVNGKRTKLLAGNNQSSVVKVCNGMQCYGVSTNSKGMQWMYHCCLGLQYKQSNSGAKPSYYEGVWEIEANPDTFVSSVRGQLH